MLDDFLRTTPLFAPLDDRQRAMVLEISTLRRYAHGADVLVEGRRGLFLHIVHKGRVRVSKLLPTGGEEALTILEEGDFFGEIEFFHPERGSSAHVVAHTDCELLSVPHEALRERMQADVALAHAMLWSIGRAVAARLRDTNERMIAVLSIPRDFQ